MLPAELGEPIRRAWEARRGAARDAKALWTVRPGETISELSGEPGAEPRGVVLADDDLAGGWRRELD